MLYSQAECNCCLGALLGYNVHSSAPAMRDCPSQPINGGDDWEDSLYLSCYDGAGGTLPKGMISGRWQPGPEGTTHLQFSPGIELA